MLYICVPTFNEAPTIGLVLWRIRKVFAEFPREYELLVYNDGSSDATADVLLPYGEVLPVTVLGGPEHVGYAAALEALLRAANERCRYPRRDAAIVMQADLTDAADLLPEFVKRFEGGADLVVGERTEMPADPTPVRRLRRLARWALRRSVAVAGVKDTLGSYRLYRMSVVRDAMKAAGSQALVGGDGWATNLDLLLATAPHARRLETVPVPPRYDLRPRPSRLRPFNDALRLYRFGRQARARRAPVAVAERA